MAAAVIGCSFDARLWAGRRDLGGEVLIADYDNFRRAAHLKYVPMPA